MAEGICQSQGLLQEESVGASGTVSCPLGLCFLSVFSERNSNEEGKGNEEEKMKAFWQSRGGYRVN